LRGISTWEAANAYAPSFIADFNRRFGKPPRSDHDAHRPLRLAATDGRQKQPSATGGFTPRRLIRN
jgi:hypothetical protein